MCLVDKRKLTTRLPPSPPLLYLEITLEPTCYRCGASVEPGALFCQQCGAPQIRVAVEPRPEADLIATRASDLSLQGPAAQHPSAAAPHVPAGRAIVLGGLLEGVLAMLGLFFLGIPLGGFFSVAFYRRRAGTAGLNSALGARLGLVSGAIGFVVFAIVGSLQLLLSNGDSGLRDEVMKQLQQRASQYPGQGQQVLDYLRSAQGWGIFVVWLTIFTFIMFLLLSTIGGAVGGAVLSKKDRPKF